MNRSTRLNLESVEARLVPAAFDIPWLQNTVTYSYVPDGAMVDGVASRLGSMLTGQSGGSEEELSLLWQSEVRRAFVQWSQATNLNIGLVYDDGSSIGVVGRPQGDTRFGDIRISARPLAGNVLAITAPPGYATDTRAGDIIVNSNFQFGVNPAAGSGKYDIFTVMLQEIGHAIGVKPSVDSTSSMYGQYLGNRAGLNADDIGQVQSLYGGTRNLDAASEGVGNELITTAWALPVNPGTTTRYVRGDLNRSSDVDVYTFVTPSGGDKAKIRLATAGRSILGAKVEFLQSSGSVTSSANGVSGENLELSVDKLKSNTKYYVRVSSSSSSSVRVGSYELRVVYDDKQADPGAAAPPVVVSDGNTNNTVATATALASQAGTTAQAFYRAYGKVESSTDVDFYKVQAPPLAATDRSVLTVQIASYKAGANYDGIAPLVRIYDTAGSLISIQNLSPINVRGTYVLTDVVGSQSFNIAVSVNGASTKDYELTAVFRRDSYTTAVSEGLQLNAAHTTEFRTLQLLNTQVFSFNLSASGTGTSVPAAVTLDIFNATGTLVTSLVTTTGGRANLQILLNAGEYTVRLRSVFAVGSTASVNIDLRVDGLTDPIGLDDPIDPTASNPDEQARPFDWITSDWEYYYYFLA